jgi:molybdopterin molybdotransferase
MVLCALIKNKIVLCLPGNPFAAVCAFETLGRLIVDRLCGLTEIGPLKAKCVAQNACGKLSNIRRLVRCKIWGNAARFPSRGHANSMLAELADCNALADIPANAPPIEAGSPLEVLLL